MHNYFTKLVLYNFLNGVNNILCGKEQRALPNNASDLSKQAYNLYKKRKK